MFGKIFQKREDSDYEPDSEDESDEDKPAKKDDVEMTVEIIPYEKLKPEQREKMEKVKAFCDLCAAESGTGIICQIFFYFSKSSCKSLFWWFFIIK